MSNGDMWKLAEPIELHSIGATEIEIDPSAMEHFSPGAFTFGDGGTGGWELDQLYDADNEPPKKLPAFPVPKQVSSGFTLSNYFNLGLAASTYYLLAPMSATFVGFYFDSPDLKDRVGWTDCTGYRLDLRRDYYCILNGPKDHTVQLQALFTNKSKTNDLKLVTEKDATGAPIYHEIAHAQDYALSWQADEFSDPGWSLNRVRIFCKMVNVVAAFPGVDAGSLSQGDWLIGNVRPLH